jgi:hypothetical protein
MVRVNVSLVSTWRPETCWLLGTYFFLLIYGLRGVLAHFVRREFEEALQEIKDDVDSEASGYRY